MSSLIIRLEGVLISFPTRSIEDNIYGRHTALLNCTKTTRPQLLFDIDDKEITSEGAAKIGKPLGAELTLSSQWSVKAGTAILSCMAERSRSPNVI